MLAIQFYVDHPVNEMRQTYEHSYSIQRSTQTKGLGQMTFAHGLLEGQFFFRFLAIVA